MEVETWIAISAALAASFSVCVAIWSTRLSKKALILAEGQEQRRRPSLVLYLADGYVRFSQGIENHRIYACLLSVSNLSDTNNSVAFLDLYLSYFTPLQLRMTVKIPSEENPSSADSVSSLVPPIVVASHQTIAGWVYFQINEDLLLETNIDGYSVVATDSHGLQSNVEQGIVRELIDETKTKEVEDPNS